MKPDRNGVKKANIRNETVRSSLRSSNGASSSSDTSPNIASRPKRNVVKRSLDISDFLTSHEEEKQLAKALKESLKELKKNNDITTTKTHNVTSKCVQEQPSKEVIRPNNPVEPTPPTQAALTRPKREAAQRVSVLTDLFCFKSKEEQELRKAIELSKRSVLEDKRKREKTPSIVSPSSPVTDLSTAASTSSASNINPLPRRREEDVKSQISDASSLDEMILKKPKIPPQRKFAQNSVPGHCIQHSTTCTPVKHLNSQSYVHNPHTKTVQVKEVFSAITPSTEDFLTFLCLRNAPALPQKVDLFSMNEKAIQEKQTRSPKLAVPTLTKSITPSKHDGVKVNGSPQTRKIFDSRRSSATSSSSVTSNPFHLPIRKSNVKVAIKSELPFSIKRDLVRKKYRKPISHPDTAKAKCPSKSTVAVKKKKSKSDLTPTKRVTRSASTSTSYVLPANRTVAHSVEDELKADREKRLKEQMIAIEKQHQVRRRFSSDSSLHSSDSSSSESLPSTSSSASINISRVTRSIETLKQLRVIGQQSKLMSTNNTTTRRVAARGQVASKAILQRAKRNLNSKSNSNGKLSKIPQ